MARLGELCLWGAFGPLALALVGSVAGAWTDRADLSRLGARASEAAAVLILFGVLGLVWALQDLQLEFAYVAGYTDLRMSPTWRLAALWSGPAGGALVLVFLIAVAGMVSARLGRSRQSVARTGALGFLSLVGLTLVVVAARPFARLPAPPAAGFGLPFPLRDPLWHVELGSVFAATALAGFTFAGVVGEQMAEAPGWHRRERRAVALAAAALTVGLMATFWRFYSGTGELLPEEGRGELLALAPVWLTAVAYLHGPGDPGKPSWAARWERALGVVLFPAALGVAAALLGGGGTGAVVPLWAGGLAVGLFSGSLTGLARIPLPSPSEPDESVPGWGGWALLGGVLSLLGAGLIAAGGLLDRELVGRGGPIAAGSLLVALVLWSLHRPAGRWPAAWAGLGAVAVAGVVLVVAYRVPTSFALGGSLFAGLIVGGVAELVRWRRARHEGRRRSDPRDRALFASRSRRRWASTTTHLGLGCLLVGLWGTTLVRSEVRQLRPGARITVDGPGGESLVYLGLSRYRVDGAQRTVASFRTGDGRLLMIESTYDWASGTERRRPVVRWGLVRDVVLEMESGTGEEIRCRVTVRPLSSFLWLGGLLLGAGLFAAGATADPELRAEGTGGESSR